MAAEHHAKREVGVWDGESPLYSETNEKFYSDESEAEDDLEDGETLADLRLLICKPNHVRQLDYDYCYELSRDDGELPSQVNEAIEAFNEAVKGIVLSWSPTDKRYDEGTTEAK